MLRILYYFIIILHVFIIINITLIPFIFALNKLSGFIKEISFLIVSFTVISNLVFRFRCPLTLVQRKIEALWGINKEYKSFLQEILSIMGFKIPHKILRFLSASFMLIDLLLLLL